MTLHWTALDGSNKRAVVQQKDVYDTRSFVTWMANHNIMSQVHSTKDFIMYIKEATRELIRRKAVSKSYEQMGWYKDGFLTGSEMVSESGATPVTVQTSNQIKALTRIGSLDRWVQGVSVLSAPNLWAQAFTVQAGFGSPLLHLAGRSCAVLSLTGESGKGKTLASAVALSIFGEPRKLTQAALATANAVDAQLAMHRHIPHLLDEVSGMPPHRIADYLYTAANGKGKDSLTRNRDARAGGEWALVPIITSNRPVTEMRKADVQEAHRRRMLELTIAEGLTPAQVAGLVDAAWNNYGAVREVYLQGVCRIRDQIPAMFSEAEAEIQRMLPGIPGANRFGLWLLTAALLGGRIAQALGLVAWDVTVPVMLAGQSLVTVAAETEMDAERVQGVIADFLAINDGDVCHWTKDGIPLTTPRKPVARVDKLSLAVFVSHKVLNEHLLEEGISRNNIKGWMDTHKIHKVTVQLTPTSPRITAYKFPASLFGLDTK